MQNKTPIIVLTGLAVVAAAAIAGLTKDQWMGEKPQVAATAPATTAPAATEAPKAPDQPAATTTTEAAKPATTTTEAAKPAEQPAATTTTAASGQPAATEQPAAQQPAAQQQAATATQAAQPAAENAADKPKVPSFDTVRVEKTGEAVIAGTAAAGSDVVVLLDGKEIGKTTANGDGAFVVVPEKPLPAGSGALTIAAKAKGDAQPTASEQSVAVIVPAADQKQEALVAVVSPDKPTRVLQKPEIKQEQAAAPAATTPAQTTTETQTASQTTVEKTTAETTTTTAAPAAEKPAKLVSIDAVDYDTAGNIVFSGGGEAGNTARVYIDNKFIGDAAVGPDGHWSFSGTADVTQGVHTLRVDGLDSAGKVLNRVEVPFFREQQSKVADAGQTAPAATTTTTTTTTTTAATPAQPPAQTETPAAQPAAGSTQQQPAAATTAPAATTPATTAPATTGQQSGTAAAPATTTGAGTATQPATTTTTTTTTTTQPATTAGGTQAAATPAAPRDGRVVIQPGNNLWRISRVLYGNGAKFTTLYEANKDQIRNPNLIYPGQIFRTPQVAPKGGAVDPKRRHPLTPEENEAPAQ